MKQKLRLTIVLSLGILLVAAPQLWGFRHLKEGERAPDFTLKNLEGKSYSLSASKGKVAIILYWRTDQVRSLNALKALKQLSVSFANQPVRILTITKDPDTSAIKEVKQSLELPFPVLRTVRKKSILNLVSSSFPLQL